MSPFFLLFIVQECAIWKKLKTGGVRGLERRHKSEMRRGVGVSELVGKVEAHFFFSISTAEDPHND